MSTTPRELPVRVGAYGLITRDGPAGLEVLLTHCAPSSRFPGQWALPGGGIDWGEHPRDTVVRELTEETSLDGTPGRLLACRSQLMEPYDRWPAGKAVGLIFAMRVGEGEPRVADPTETADAVAWHPLSDLPTLAWNAAASLELLDAGARSQEPSEDRPGPGLGVPRRPRSSRRRLGAYAIATNHEGEVPRVLLTKLAADDPEADSWNLPGGGVKPEESPLEALTREFHEETGLIPADVAVHDVDSRVYEAWGSKQVKHSIGVIYRATATGTPRVVETGGSTAEVAWWPTDQLDELRLSQLAQSALADHVF
ncbi:MAG: NUDIX domain-containing protein [Microthrixaceae bacterium]